MKRFLFLLVNALMALGLSAQNYQKGYMQKCISPSLLTYYWPACWISSPNSDNQYDVCHFRKSFVLEEKPENFIIHVSADNRYKLYANGQLVSLGPARCDIFNWNFETVDIAPFLQVGKNSLAAVVWNYGEHKPMAQISYAKTELIVQGNSQKESVINTDASWLCMKDPACSVCATGVPKGYYVAGPGEAVDSNLYPWGWEHTNYQDDGWKKAIVGSHGAAKGTRDYTGRLLVPTPIPPMERKEVRFGNFKKMMIPPFSNRRILLDNNELTTGYLSLLFSKGKNASISIGYAESLYEPGSDFKGNRNETQGKEFWGYRDNILADGGLNRTFTSLWWRTWRYLELIIETKEESLEITDIYGTTSYYPFAFESKFQADGREDLQQILDIGIRTARLCANETYMDCPYYEQMQYFGDTRIQTMISLYNTRDTCLVKRAIELGRQSISADGITMSRYPTESPQFIPPYALSWIGIIYDYWMMRDDVDYVRSLLPSTRSIIAWYEQWLMEDGSLGKIPYWSFADWAKEFVQGEPRKDSTGHSAFMDLELLKALQEIAKLERSLGLSGMAQHYEETAHRIRCTFKDKYWVSEKGLFADTKEQDSFSQHVNTLAILTGIVDGTEAKKLFLSMYRDNSIAQCTVYYRYYLNQAMAMAGLGDELLYNLDIWKKQIDLGLTTWAESPEPSRSDCHAWGASPNVEFFRTVLGIRSMSSGFKEIEISPSLGPLQSVSGSIPHPNGEIAVSYSRNSKELEVIISLPEKTSGKFHWQGYTYMLEPGVQTLSIDLKR